jgi:hypothetical protein
MMNESYNKNHGYGLIFVIHQIYIWPVLNKALYINGYQFEYPSLLSLFLFQTYDNSHNSGAKAC